MPHDRVTAKFSHEHDLIYSIPHPCHDTQKVDMDLLRWKLERVSQLANKYLGAPDLASIRQHWLYQNVKKPEFEIRLNDVVLSTL